MPSPPSESNFILVQSNPSRRSARELYIGLKERQILVRYFDTPELGDKLRITIGTPAENDGLISALKQLL